MRIQVLFDETSVLVPCGDGKLTVKELVDKAIVRFKKVLNKVSERWGRLAAMLSYCRVLCKQKRLPAL